MNVDASAALRATGAKARHAARLPSTFHVSTDTRTLVPGDTFLALRGERFDGHAFVAQALAAGAVAVVVEDASVVPESVPALVVADTLRAYLALAAVARDQLHARVVAVTGSTGKTTTTALLAQLLQRCEMGTIAATPGNENNEIGVSKLFLGLEPESDVVIVEFGARHYGEIEPLARAARPDIAILTNVGDAHLEIMGSRERLAETKFGIFAGGAQPVLNLFDSTSRERAKTLEPLPHWFGAAPSWEGEFTVNQPVTLIAGRRRLIFSDGVQHREEPVQIDLPGDHNLSNLAAALAAALELGCAAEKLVASLAHLSLPAGRYERSRIGDFEIIFDAYNASMEGTLATLRSFAHEHALERIAVLGSMAELGPDAPAMHEQVGATAAQAGLGALLVGGRYADALAHGARAGGLDSKRIVHFAHNSEAVDWLRAHARGGALVLFKGSRMYKLEEIVDGLRLAYAR